jgi:protein-export membrane protein SecD
MKRCPACSRVYDDVSLRFCLDDGTELQNKVPDGGAPETALFSASSENAAPTIEAAPPAVAPVNQNLSPPLPADGRKRRLLPWIIGGAAFLVVVVPALIAFGLVFRPKAPLKWHLTLQVQPAATADAGAVVNQTVSVIESRLNAAGVSRFEVKPDGTKIVVNLPAVEDPERIKSLITAGGKLELVHVISPPNPSLLQTYDTEPEAIASLNSSGTLPSNRRVLPYDDRDFGATGSSRRWVVVESPPIVDGRDLRDASAAKSSYGEDYDILFTLNKAGAAKLSAWTGANINEYLGIILNDEAKSIPYIKSQISDQGQISGRFTRQSANDLALVLKSGALPAPVKLVEEGVDK